MRNSPRIFEPQGPPSHDEDPDQTDAIGGYVEDDDLIRGEIESFADD